MGLEVVVVAHADRPHAGFKHFAFESAGTIGGGEIGGAVSDNHEVVQRQDGGKVGVRLGQNDLDGQVVHLADLGHLLGQRVGFGAHGRVKVTVHRVHDIIRAQRFTVVELYAGLQLDGPGLSIVGFDAVGQLHLHVAVTAQECQAVIVGAAADIVGGQCRLGRVQRVGGGRRPTCGFQRAARCRRCGNGGCRMGQKRPTCGHGHTRCHKHFQQLAARCAAADHVFNRCIIAAGPVCGCFCHF